MPGHCRQLASSSVPFYESIHPLITPILRNPHTDTEGTEDGAEARMRQALGKLGIARPGKPEAPRRANYQAGPGAARHRFKQDGEVPVIRLSMGEGGRHRERQSQAPADRIKAAAGQGQAGKGSDQGSADGTRQVQELVEQLRATQTRLGHAELVASEATRAAHARQEETIGLRLALDEAEATLVQVRAELAASERARKELEGRQNATHHPGLQTHARENDTIRRKVGRPLGPTNRVHDQKPDSEPEPVKWWAGE